MRLLILVFFEMYALCFCCAQEFDKSFGRNGILVSPDKKHEIGSIVVDSLSNIYTVVYDSDWDRLFRHLEVNLVVYKFDSNGKPVKEFGRRGKLKASITKRRSENKSLNVFFLEDKFYVRKKDAEIETFIVYNLEGNEESKVEVKNSSDKGFRPISLKNNELFLWNWLTLVKTRLDAKSKLKTIEILKLEELNDDERISELTMIADTVQLIKSTNNDSKYKREELNFTLKGEILESFEIMQYSPKDRKYFVFENGKYYRESKVDSLTNSFERMIRNPISNIFEVDYKIELTKEDPDEHIGFVGSISENELMFIKTKQFPIVRDGQNWFNTIRQLSLVCRTKENKVCPNFGTYGNFLLRKKARIDTYSCKMLKDFLLFLTPEGIRKISLK